MVDWRHRSFVFMFVNGPICSHKFRYHMKLGIHLRQCDHYRPIVSWVVFLSITQVFAGDCRLWWAFDLSIFRGIASRQSVFFLSMVLTWLKTHILSQFQDDWRLIIYLNTKADQCCGSIGTPCLLAIAMYLFEIDEYDWLVKSPVPWWTSK